MSDNLVIGGATFTGVTGIKATDTNDNVVTFESGGGPYEIARLLQSNQLTTYHDTAITTFRPHAFLGASKLETVICESVTAVGESALNTLTKLTTVKLPSAKTFSSYALAGCKALPLIVLPAVTSMAAETFKACTALTTIDLGVSAAIANYSQRVFQNCSNLTTLIIRKSSVMYLQFVNDFDGTPFASGKAGGTLYVPSALVASYKSATNWSAIFGYGSGEQNQVLPIEGSIYETQYADGTPIPTT